MQIPLQWHQYYRRRGYFITYFGDIYSGIIYEFQEIPDSIFIVPNIHLKSVRELQSKHSISSEALSQYAWEIKDLSIITKVFDAEKIGHDTPSPDGTIYGEQRWRQMFVFGAGASSFCVPREEQERLSNFTLRPPLGNDLFASKFRALLDKYDGVKLCLPSLKRLKNDVEAFFESEWSLLRDNYNPTLLSRHINLLYYLQELFFTVSDATNREFYDCSLYSSLIDTLQKKLHRNPLEKVAFVSFNYDTILDYNISAHFNVQFNSIVDYVDSNQNPFLYFKPHGSSNWGWPFVSEESRDKIDNTPMWLYSNKICFDQIYYKHLGELNEMTYSRGWAYERKYSINKNKIEVIGNEYPRRYLPALLVPYRDKDDFVMPYYHQDAMGHFMNVMEDIFFIGWKGNEATFNKLLKERAHNLRRIIIVNPNHKEVVSNLSGYLNEMETKYELLYFDHFEDLVNADILSN